MLVLSRKVGQEIVVGDSVTIVVNKISGNRVTLGIKAPQSVHIVRGELEPIVDAFRDCETSRETVPPLPTDFGLKGSSTTACIPRSVR